MHAMVFAKCRWLVISVRATGDVNCHACILRAGPRASELLVLLIASPIAVACRYVNTQLPSLNVGTKCTKRFTFYTPSCMK